MVISKHQRMLINDIKVVPLSTSLLLKLKCLTSNVQPYHLPGGKELKLTSDTIYQEPIF